MKSTLTHYRKNAGFSLIETFFAVFIVIGLLSVVLGVVDDYSKKLLAKTKAEYINQVRLSVEDMLKNPALFNTIHTAFPANGLINTSIDELRMGFAAAGGVRVNNFENNFADNTLFPNGLSIMLRQADDPLDPNDIMAMEIIIASNDRVPFKDALNIASELKGYGGLLENLANNVQSVFASWQFDEDNLMGVPWHTLVTGSGNAPSMASGVYVVAYEYINFNDVTGDYLYRNDVGDPDLNRMYTNLDLGANNILGVDDLGGVGFESGPMTVDSLAILNGTSLIVNNNTTVNAGNYYPSRDFNAGNVNIRGVTTTSDTPTTQTGYFISSGNVDVGTRLGANQLRANTATVNGNYTTGGDLHSEVINANGDINATGTAHLRNLQFINPDSTIWANSINIGQVTTNNLTLDGGNTVGFENIQATNGTIGRLNVQQLLTINTLNVGTFGACDRGC